MRRLVPLLVVVLALGGAVDGAVAAAGGGRGAGAATGRAPARAKKKVRCHWVKATRKRQRHRVCVKVRAKRRPAAVRPVAPAKPVAPVAPAPATPGAPGDAGTPPLPAPPGETLPAPQPEPAPAPPAPGRVQITSREFTLTLSRAALAAGPAIVELVNRGEDPHDLHLRRAGGGGDVLSIGETLPGGVAHAGATLAAGSYVLYCGLPGHALAGMKAALTVG